MFGQWVQSLAATAVSAQGGPPPTLPVVDRGFRADLLPDYAAYLVAVVLLMAAVVWVLRRKSHLRRDR